ncbi:hypothetical protein AXG93_1550s1070 [Marchantia polymorpha subsp. ruderalis]|uniref:Uncharacterized protein n=1 Tax=Marchantia polymorpha subsp. ruderalis TaxID=1480154 RepID=A0A176WRF9_MARPO|nr:hypothetical protein AXG93_1550s1070 [Marchantia polymorpha subsp. ruderalis]
MQVSAQLLSFWQNLSATLPDAPATPAPTAHPAAAAPHAHASECDCVTSKMAEGTDCIDLTDVEASQGLS